MSGARILIVDRDIPTAQYLAQQFQKEGYRSFTASTAKEGLIETWRNRPHLIVLDPVRSDLSLKEFVDKLRKDKRTQKTPLIAFSSLSNPQEIQAAIDIGFDHYLTKEGDAMNALMAVVKSLLSDASSAPKKEKKAPDATAPSPMMNKDGKTVVFLSAKGGTGTSSICANMATMFKKYETEASFVMVDLVLPIGSIASTVGYDGPLNIIEASIMTDAEASADYLRQALPMIEKWNFQLLAGSPNPEQANDLDISRIPVLLKKLTTAFDYVFVDLGRSLSRISLPIILSADQVILIMGLEASTVAITKTALEYLRKQGLRQEQIFPLLNRAVGLEGLPKSEVEEMLALTITGALPYVGEYFSLASNVNMPFQDRFPDNVVTIALREMYEAIKKRMSEARTEIPRM